MKGALRVSRGPDLVTLLCPPGGASVGDATMARWTEPGFVPPDLLAGGRSQADRPSYLAPSPHDLSHFLRQADDVEASRDLAKCGTARKHHPWTFLSATADWTAHGFSFPGGTTPLGKAAIIVADLFRGRTGGASGGPGQRGGWSPAGSGVAGIFADALDARLALLPSAHLPALGRLSNLARSFARGDVDDDPDQPFKKPRTERKTRLQEKGVVPALVPLPELRVPVPAWAASGLSAATLGPFHLEDASNVEFYELEGVSSLLDAFATTTLWSISPDAVHQILFVISGGDDCMRTEFELGSRGTKPTA